LAKLEAAPNARYGDGGAWGNHGSFTRPCQEKRYINNRPLEEITVNHAELPPRARVGSRRRPRNRKHGF
jgi:hypothetical protein